VTCINWGRYCNQFSVAGVMFIQRIQKVC